jgi:hypothetical protein
MGESGGDRHQAGGVQGGGWECGRREEAGRPSAPCCCKFITFAPVPPPPLAASLPACLQATTTTGTSCDTQYFTKTEDRPIVKERVEYVQEHRPVEKEFVVGAHA